MPISDQIFYDPHGDRRVRHPAAADEPVLSARAGAARRRRRPAAQRALSLRRVRQPRHDRHERRRGRWSAASRARAKNWDFDSTRSTTARTRPRRSSTAASAVLAHPAAAQQRHRQPVRAEHAGRLAAGRRRPRSPSRRSTPSRRATASTSRRSGDIYKLPAGPLALARRLAGAQGNARRRTRIRRCRPATSRATAATSCDIDQSRTNVRGLRRVQRSRSSRPSRPTSAVRYDHYSDFGSTTNPKVSLRWQPVRRCCCAGRGARASSRRSLYQLYDPQTPGLSQPGLSDPIRCPDRTGDANNPDCNTQFGVTFGGNPALKPEKAKQTTLGVVWEPVSGLLGRHRLLQDRPEEPRHERRHRSGRSWPTSTQYGYLVTRAAPCAPYPNRAGPPCPITAIDQRFVNLGEAKIEGIDVDARQVRRPTPTGAASRRD